jgi:hypothetical protein
MRCKYSQNCYKIKNENDTIKQFLLKSFQLLVIQSFDFEHISDECYSRNVSYARYIGLFVWLLVFNATFNNISVVSWRSDLLVEDPEKTTDLPQVIDKLYHIVLYTSPWSRFELTTLVVTGTDCIDSCKSNYHTITTTTASKCIGFY